VLTFILLDYKSAVATIQCVAHFLQKCKSTKDEISFVVVDNSDDDANFRLLSSAWTSISVRDYEGLTLEEKSILGCRLFLCKNSCNVGYAKGNNLGAKIADVFLHSDYFIFSNNDLLILDEHLSIDALIQEAQKPDVGIVGPSIVGKNGKAQNPYREKRFFLRWELEYFCYPFSRFLPKFLRSGDLQEKFICNPVFRVMGAFFLISKDLFKKVGGFDPHTFLFAEELILSKKISREGYVTHYLPSIHLLHNHSEIINRKYDYSKRLLLRFESECYYYKMYKGVGAFQLKIAELIMKSYIFRKRIVKAIKSFVK
jgi:GT2 family glycosyltransferase